MSAPSLVTPLAQSPERVLRRLYLTLFLRGRSARGISKGSTPTTVGRKLLQVLLFYALFGLIAFSFMRQSVFVLATYLHALTFIFLGMFVATSAGEVLFNKEESDILMHRPIHPRTMLWAKIGVLVQISLWLAGALNAGGLITGVFASDGGWRFPLAHALSTVLEALFCTAFVVLVYQLCLRWFGREKLDAFMTATQVIVSVVVVLGGQLVPQLMIRREGTLLVSVKHWWMVLLPPSWFAGIDDALGGSGAATSWWLALLALSATAVVIWLAFGKLASDFQTGLQSLSEAPTRGKTRARRRILERMLRVPPFSWWLRDGVSRTAFLLSAAYLVRDREVKLRVYPGIAPMLVMPIIILLPHGGNAGATGDFGVAFAGSYLGLIPLMTLGMLEFSQQWQASDIFRVAPLSGPGALCHGARRAVLFLITLPMLLIFGFIVLLMGQSVTQLQLMIPGILAVPVYAMIPCLGGQGLPLARPPEEGKAASRPYKMIGVMIVSSALAAVTALAHRHGWLAWLVSVEVVVVAVIYAFMRRNVTRAPWKFAE